ncbi:MAG: glycoside hydrolase family protein [Solirubrobacteraceae bacterium]
MADAQLANILAIAKLQIERDEGCREVAYPDPLSGGDPWTIGYGETGPDIKEGTVWTPAQIDAAFNVKLSNLAGELDAQITWWKTLGAARSAVLFEMAYQMGVSGLAGFEHMLAAARSGNFMLASALMLESAWARQTPERARREAEQMRRGVVVKP